MTNIITGMVLKTSVLVWYVPICSVISIGLPTDAQQVRSAAQSSSPSAQVLYSEPAAPAVYKLEDSFLRWPVPAGLQAYAAIDGKHLHTFVVQQAEISRRFRDQGHPQYWGRITGSSADAESARWLSERFKQAGLTDVHVQPLPIPDPVWEPVQPWALSATSGANTLQLSSAQPPYLGAAAPPGGMNLEAVYVGTGSEADFLGRDVRGKAAIVYSVPFPAAVWQTAQSEGVYRRAEEKGAAAILVILALPGNFRVQGYPTHGKIPTFGLGMEDGYRLRNMIGEAPAGQLPHIQIRFQTRMVSGEKTATVWGTLPGATNETIYIMAHRDGWFDGASDNGSGVATMIGLAEYFAKVPQENRRRTIIFMGVSGHHGPSMSSQDLLARKEELFSKTALLINAEHTSTLQTYDYWEAIRWSNTYTAQYWYAGGPSRPRLQDIAVNAFHAFGVSTYAAPEKGAPRGDAIAFWPFLPVVTTTDANMYFHSDGETPEIVPWTGLEATTRAYAKIIDDVNEMDITELQRPEEKIEKMTGSSH